MKYNIETLQLRERTTSFDSDWLSFWLEGKEVAGFGTTKESLVRYNSLRARWNHKQIDLEQLKKCIVAICTG